MQRFEIRFFGCKRGAIGMHYAITATREASDPDAAVLALYDEYEHVQNPKVRELGRSERAAVTDWSDWRDIFKSESVRELDSKPVRSQLELDAYRKRTTAHTWYLEDWSVRDPERRKHAPKVPCYLSRFVELKIQTGTDADRSWRSVYLDCEFTEQAIDIVSRHSVLVDYDTMSFQVIEWPDGRALVVCHNSKIVGGPWVAKIDASTIPAELRKVNADE